MAIHAGALVAVLLSGALPPGLIDIVSILIAFESPMALVACVVSLPSVFVRISQKQFRIAAIELILLACVALSAGFLVAPGPFA